MTVAIRPRSKSDYKLPAKTKLIDRCMDCQYGEVKVILYGYAVPVHTDPTKALHSGKQQKEVNRELSLRHAVLSFWSSILRPISLHLNAGFGSGGLRSMWIRVWQCCSLLHGDASWTPVALGSSEGSSNGSKQPDIWGQPWIEGLPGNLTLTRLDEKHLRDSAFWALYRISEAVCR